MRPLSYILLATVTLRASLPAEARAASVDLSLNVYPRDVLQPNAGGFWSVTAKTDAPHGIATLDMYFANVDAELPGIPGPSIYPQQDLHALRIGHYPPITVSGDVVNFLYTQDLSVEDDVVTGVGTPIMSDAPDPFGEPAWTDATLIVTGTYSAAIPAFASLAGTLTNADVFTSSEEPFPAIDAVTSTIVRVVASRPKTPTLVDQGFFTLDPATGLRWLDPGASRNRTYLDVSTQFGPGGDFEGLRYATGDEVLVLFEHAGITEANNGFMRESYAAASAFLELIGDFADPAATPAFRAAAGVVGDLTPLGFIRIPDLGVDDANQTGIAHWLGGQAPTKLRQKNVGHWLVEVAPGSAPSSGDFDFDDDVDGDDLAVWRTSLGLNNGGDADYDGDTDGRDLLIWQRQFGASNAPAPHTTVPEPASWTILVCLGALASLSKCRRVFARF